MFCSQFDTNLLSFKITKSHLCKATHQQVSACPKVIADHTKNVKIYINLARCSS